MILTAENYHSLAMNQQYLSSSQYHDFCGTLGRLGCEERALNKIRGDWEDKTTTAMLVGSYVDAHFTENLAVFKSQHPEILKKDGSLLSTFLKADEVINRIERDEYFMRYMQGEKQRIFTADLWGAEWKCKIDVMSEYRIVDLKTTASITKSFWVKDWGRISFLEYWGIIQQMALYQKIVEINIKKKLPIFVAVASKEPAINIEIIGFTETDLSDTLSLMEPNIKRIIQLKKGKVLPGRCSVCAYCRNSKVLTRPIHYSELELDV